MSRIGKQPIDIPNGVDVKLEGDVIKVKGPKGQLEQKIHEAIKVEIKDKVITVTPKVDNKCNSKFHGLVRSLLFNMVEGVSKGVSKELKIIGVGYRAALKGKTLELSLGYSHPIIYNPPKGIELKLEKRDSITVMGFDKALVGQVAANIRGFRKPEPYHGKGIRYVDEHIVTKVGKAGVK